MSESLLTDWKSLPSPIATAGSVIVPRCPTCGGFETVAPVQVAGVDPGVDYWSCTACGLTWGTRWMNTAREPFRRRCPGCEHAGRYDDADPAWDHYFICVACGRRWMLRAHYALTA
jgi:hypothetical protein